MTDWYAECISALGEIEQAMHGCGPLSRGEDSDTLDQIGERAGNLLTRLRKSRLDTDFSADP